ncbi:26686_t:CDS:2 [Dentiscutata erythropus]|uniref:26686_t:CDS:1 n=1 Tax=Dentiscutata erythropus TaxID=1348616 RepID=A0A9N9IAY2_9GLOM|nr:26686_t:CDS:2 [Dentiscutata erythropus]
MSDDINAERLPLLETQEDRNPIDCKEQSIVTNNSISYSNLPTDVSKIPYDYKLRFKSFWEYNYIIEGYPTEFNGESNNQPEFIKYAEIVVPYWTYGNFNVIEFRYHSNGSVSSVSTVTSRIDGYLTNDVDILFTVSDDDVDFGLKSCEYRISWTWLFNGYILRRCKKVNETVFNLVAFIRGHPAWGLNFLSVDEKIKYGYSSRAAFFWNLYVRDVYVDPAAPFPPIIPTLYTAYYNYLERIRQRKGNKRDDNTPTSLTFNSSFRISFSKNLYSGELPTGKFFTNE